MKTGDRTPQVRKCPFHSGINLVHGFFALEARERRWRDIYSTQFKAEHERKHYRRRNSTASGFVTPTVAALGADR